MLRLFANLIWIRTPAGWQKRVSFLLSRIFQLKLSRFLIVPYCLFFGLDGDYLDQFEPDNESAVYSSYSDFFERKYKVQPPFRGETVWPCEGYVCEWGVFEQSGLSWVKGQWLDRNLIFRTSDHQTRGLSYTNIFLHNHNYHRIHAPVTGTVVRIETVPGDLVFLRPWFYQRAEVSYPAVRNERTIIEIRDDRERNWYLALVGGFGVGTILVADELHFGARVNVGQEIARFRLGSTLCLATPEVPAVNQYLQTVRVGERWAPKSSDSV